MRKLACLLVATLFLAFWSFPQYASASGGAEVELIVDFLNRQQVTIIIPSAVDPSPLADLLSSIVNSPLHMVSDWETADGLHVWLYSSPHLIHGFGAHKSELWDFSQLASTAASMGLTDGVKLFLVLNQPNGALSYNAYVSDAGSELDPAASDELEVWWGFGLQADGGAPQLSILLWLRPLFSWLTLLPLWLPLLGLFLLWVVGPRLKLAAFCRLSRVVTWLAIWASVILTLLMQWPAVTNFLFSATDGLPGQAAFLLTMLLPFSWSSMLTRLPLHCRLARERRQVWSLGQYLRDAFRFSTCFTALLIAGMLWFALAQSLARYGFGLAIFSGVITAALVAWLLTELAPVFTWGRPPGADLGAEAMLRSLSGRLRIPPPELHFIPLSKSNQANAFATGTLIHRVYLTQLLWDSLPQREQQFILAHELAHIQRRDATRILALLLVPLSLVASGVSILLLVDAGWTLPLALGLLLVACLTTLLVALPWRRRAEMQSDAIALQATGDLPGAISALERVQSINQANLLVETKRSTHPRLPERLQALRLTATAQQVRDRRSQG